MSETIQAALIGAGSALVGVLLTMLVSAWRDAKAAERNRVKRRFDARREVYARLLADTDALRRRPLREGSRDGTPDREPAFQTIAELLLIASRGCAEAAVALLEAITAAASTQGAEDRHGSGCIHSRRSPGPEHPGEGLRAQTPPRARATAAAEAAPSDGIAWA